jgi:hypothetical protein
VGRGEELLVHVREVGRDADGGLGGVVHIVSQLFDAWRDATHSRWDDEFIVTQRVVGSYARCAEEDAVRETEGFVDYGAL